MENIFSKIDKIFELDSDTAPKWAQELLSEIQEVKKLLRKKSSIPTITPYQNAADVKSFIRGFKKMLKNDEMFIYQAREIGLNEKGLLYDINTNSTLNTKEAYEVYGYIYNHNIEIKKQYIRSA
jgi:archaellum biogenesis ATPase FlaH